MERHIFLVGMPGSGKSALGRRVAQKLQIPYLDTDVYLTEATGMNTAQLYTTFGEQAFRDGETRLLQQLVHAFCKLFGRLIIRYRLTRRGQHLVGVKWL